jgi:hypothetical protein
MITSDAIAAIAGNAIFGKPLVTNVYRSVLTEAIVAAALPEWKWCSEDYAAYDFIHPDGTRLEVKQSAVRQSWAADKPSRLQWDIAARKGYWQGNTWVKEVGRNTDVYVLCSHPVATDDADHRDPAQWQFYVIAARDLPETKTMVLGSLARLTDPVGFDELEQRVTEVRSRFMSTDIANAA